MCRRHIREHLCTESESYLFWIRSLAKVSSSLGIIPMGLFRYESVCSYTFLHMTAVSLLVSIDSVPTGITSKSFLDEKTYFGIT